jgi:uncharacterized phage infection (PIP) family protein YhgE
MHPLPPVYYVIFTAITAAAVLLQALVLLALFLVLRKAMGKLLGITDELKEQALPLLASTRSLVEDVTPKLKTATSNLTEVSHTLRQQANHLNETLSALLDKTNTQIRRVDEMVTGTFDAVDQATRAVENAVAIPVRRMSGVIRGLKAGIETFLSRKPASREKETAESAEAQEKKPA